MDELQNIHPDFDSRKMITSISLLVLKVSGFLIKTMTRNLTVYLKEQKMCGLANHLLKYVGIDNTSTSNLDKQLISIVTFIVNHVTIIQEGEMIVCY